MNKKSIRFIGSTIVTSLMLITLIFVVLTKISTNFKMDTYFWTTFIIGTIIMILTLILWLPSGKESGEKTEKFKNNKDLYDKKANTIIKKQYFDKLRAFCDHKNELLRLEKTKAMLGQFGINYDDFLKFNSKEEILSDPMLTKKQKKIIISIKEKGVKFSRVSTYQLTTSIDSSKGENYRNLEKIKQIVYIIFRILLSIAISLFLASIVITTKAVTLAEITQLFIWITAIGTNLVSSIYYGYNLVVVDRNQYYIKLNTILYEFEEWAKISINDTTTDSNANSNNLSTNE
jgi:hypothetical protein